ncbi:MAG: PEP-CTERM sorting domain-containing protein [Armatimonadota bacterium]
MSWRHVLNWPAQLTAIHAVLLLLFALSPATSAGQGFFDDFDGEDLGSHWSTGNPKGGWIYSVHDSLLEVYGFTGFLGGREWITARTFPYDDFDFEARVGWTGEPQFERLNVAIGGGYPNDRAVALMGFRRTIDDGRQLSTVVASFRDGPRVEMAAPSSGFHTFRVTRSAGVFSAYFNQELILQGTGSGMPADTIVLLFGGNSTTMPVDLLVDRVSVVPEPASGASLVLALAALFIWRRKSR